MSTPKFSRLDPAQRREQILDAASALFAERAYDEVSLEDGLPRDAGERDTASSGACGCLSGAP